MNCCWSSCRICYWLTFTTYFKVSRKTLHIKHPSLFALSTKESRESKQKQFVRSSSMSNGLTSKLGPFGGCISNTLILFSARFCGLGRSQTFLRVTVSDFHNLPEVCTQRRRHSPPVPWDKLDTDVWPMTVCVSSVNGPLSKNTARSLNNFRSVDSARDSSSPAGSSVSRFTGSSSQHSRDSPENRLHCPEIASIPSWGLRANPQQLTERKWPDSSFLRPLSTQQGRAIAPSSSSIRYQDKKNPLDTTPGPTS